ncbi:hypothetical protein D9758_001417 [Tetrapyrgos nigripes]|uniref:Uncharacterized protein n=1 Tax=Tetrapyrgos nigripes TaxID=182062 RepID=A0A8H5GS30_9AGAR|nr:hypothetical protein D9758_001417 [Tetrapyrgos nigripes]
MDSIPRPPVVKRVRQDANSMPASSGPSTESKPAESKPHRVKRSLPRNRGRPVNSRPSSGRTRSDHTTGDNAAEDKRESRNDSRDAPICRNGLTHTHSERGARERDGDHGKHRDRRDGERDRDRDRDHEKDCERDRDRDRDRHGDRHRRDETDGDRGSRKERESRNRGPLQGSGGDDRTPPSRPDPSQHRSAIDEFRKWRRDADEDSKRGSSKRNSRREPRSEDCAGCRAADKDRHDRRGDTERQRRERDGDGDNRGSDKSGEQRQDAQPTAPSGKVSPASTPSALRAICLLSLREVRMIPESTPLGQKPSRQIT